MYYYPEQDLSPSEKLVKRISFDVSPTKKFGIHGLHFTATGRIGSEHPGLVMTDWISRECIVLPTLELLQRDSFPRDLKLHELIPDLATKGWKLDLIVPEKRKAEGYLEGFCADYRQNDKRIAMFAFQFTDGSHAQAFFDEKLQEWDTEYALAGERSLVKVTGERITRWVLPKHGITYGWIRGTIVLLMYGPNADDADMREFVLSLKLTQTV